MLPCREVEVAEESVLDGIVELAEVRLVNGEDAQLRVVRHARILNKALSNLLVQSLPLFRGNELVGWFLEHVVSEGVELDCGQIDLAKHDATLRASTTSRGSCFNFIVNSSITASDMVCMSTQVSSHVNCRDLADHDSTFCFRMALRNSMVYIGFPRVF